MGGLGLLLLLLTGWCGSSVERVESLGDGVGEADRGAFGDGHGKRAGSHCVGCITGVELSVVEESRSKL